jgi:hypothetical protein
VLGHLTQTLNKSTMKETVRELESMPGYYVSDHGNVYSTKECRVLRNSTAFRPLQPKVNPEGYYFVGLYATKGKRTWINLQRLVYETFVGPISHKMQIDHVDGDKSNNNISNLEMVTHSENIKRYWTRRRALKAYGQAN